MVNFPKDCVVVCHNSKLRVHFQRLKPYVLLSSSHEDIVWFQKTWNATGLVCNAFILLFMLSFCNKYLWLFFYLPATCFILSLRVHPDAGPTSLQCSGPQSFPAKLHSSSMSSMLWQVRLKNSARLNRDPCLSGSGAKGIPGAMLSSYSNSGPMKCKSL